MRRTEVLQGYERCGFFGGLREMSGRRLSYLEAAETLGMSDTVVSAARDRYESEGAAGLLDRRLGKRQSHRIGVDEVSRIVSLYRIRYSG